MILRRADDTRLHTEICAVLFLVHFNGHYMDITALQNITHYSHFTNEEMNVNVK